MKKNMYVIAVLILVVAVGAAFYRGLKYGQSSAQTAAGDAFRQRQANGVPGAAGRGGQFGNMRAGNGAGAVAGEILSKDDTSLTVKLPDGGSKIVFYSASTKIEKTVDGVVADLIVGKSIFINGKANADGSVVAESIQMRPAVVLPNAKSVNSNLPEMPANLSR